MILLGCCQEPFWSLRSSWPRKLFPWIRGHWKIYSNISICKWLENVYFYNLKMWNSQFSKNCKNLGGLLRVQSAVLCNPPLGCPVFPYSHQYVLTKCIFQLKIYHYCIWNKCRRSIDYRKNKIRHIYHVFMELLPWKQDQNNTIFTQFEYCGDIFNAV